MSLYAFRFFEHRLVTTLSFVRAAAATGLELGGISCPEMDCAEPVTGTVSPGQLPQWDFVRIIQMGNAGTVKQVKHL